MNLSGAARQPIDESMRNSPKLPTIDVNSETLHVKSSESTAIHPGYFPPGVYTPKTLGPNSHTGLFLLDQAALPLPTMTCNPGRQIPCCHRHAAFQSLNSTTTMGIM